MSGRIGIDRTMGFHRIAAFGLLLFALLHPLPYVADTMLIDPDAAWSRLTGVLGSPRLGTGVAALVGLMLIVAFGVLRERVNISFETWRASHGLMAGVVAGFTLHHVLTSGAYSPERPLRAVWISLAALAVGALLTVHVDRPWRMWRQGWRVDQVRPLGSEPGR